jgi:hypothetical protein
VIDSLPLPLSLVRAEVGDDDSELFGLVAAMVNRGSLRKFRLCFSLKFEGNLTSGWGVLAARPKIHSKIILFWVKMKNDKRSLSKLIASPNSSYLMVIVSCDLLAKQSIKIRPSPR